MRKRQKRHLGNHMVGSDEWKCYIEDGHVVVHQFGKPRFIKALPLDKVVEHVSHNGADSIKPKKAFPHPELGFIQ